MPTVGENGIHEIQVTSKSDVLRGDNIRVEYIPQSGDDSITGDSVTGVGDGGVMFFTTDFSQIGISPGRYQIEFIRSDGTEERQINLINQGDNQATVRVTDARSI
jgi:hypothetical protein